MSQNTERSTKILTKAKSIYWNRNIFYLLIIEEYVHGKPLKLLQRFVRFIFTECNVDTRLCFMWNQFMHLEIFNFTNLPKNNDQFVTI